MSFEDLIEKVSQAEGALEASERRTATRFKQLKLVWKESWTPGRIVIAGLAAGFAVGHAKPLKLAGSSGVLNLVSALSGLMASGSAQAAADQAGNAANAADSAAAQASPPAMDDPFDIGSQ